MPARCCCSSAVDLRLERALRAFEVGFPGAEALLDAALHLRERLGESLRELALADGELAPALVREPPLLRRVRRDSVRVLTRERDAELLDLRRGLLLGGGAHARQRLAATTSVLGARAARVRAAEREAQDERDDEGAATSAPTRIQARP